MVTPEVRSARAAAWFFALVAAVAFVFYTFVWGAQLQIGSDDLRLLSERPSSLIHATLDAFVAHWSTVPYLISRILLYPVFGFNHPVAWVAVGTAAWVATAALVRVLARRAGAGPWIATVAAVAVLTCADIYPQAQPHTFQVPLAVAFGLAVAVLAERGSFWWTVLLGLLAIMSSSSGIPFVVAGAVILWLRRGLRTAVAFAAGLGGVYIAWYLVFGPDEPPKVPLSLWDLPPSAAADWLITGMVAAFTALGHWRWVAALLLVVMVAGTVVAWLRWRPRSDLVAVTAVAAVGMLHLALTFALRYWVGAEGAKDYRYLYVTVATLLPLLAVAFTALGRLWQPFGVLPVLLVIGAAGNVMEFPAVQRQFVTMSTVQAQQMVQLATSPLIDQVPGWVTPHPALLFRDGLNLTTVDYLRAVRDAGRLPTGLPVFDKYEHEIPVRLGFANTYEPVPEGAACRDVYGPVLIDEPVGSRIGLSGGALFTDTPIIGVARVDDPASAIGVVSREPNQFEITLPGPYVLQSQDPGRAFVLCTW